MTTMLATVDIVYSPSIIDLLDFIFFPAGFSSLVPSPGPVWALGTNAAFSTPGSSVVSVEITDHLGPSGVPEPATSVLLLSGLVMGGLAKLKRAREKRRSTHL